MNGIYPWIYLDYAKSIWKFWINDNKELCYNIIDRERKWTKESLIDTEVLAFAVYVQEDEVIHIIYSNQKRELKYCTMRNDQWVGKTLYHVESDEFEIQYLKLEIIGNDMHILYMLTANNGSDRGRIMHCKWNGEKVTINTLQDIILVPDMEEYYVMKLKSGSELKLFFVTDEGDEAALQYCSFEKNKWTPVKRLYGIRGENISFKVLSDDVEINILNKYREDSRYLLDHVTVDTSGFIQNFRVYDSSNELVEPLLFVESSILYACWIEQGGIFYSIFDGEKWGEAVCVEEENELPLQRYNCFIFDKRENSIYGKEVYGTGEGDVHLFIPEEFVKKLKESWENNINNEDFALPLQQEDLKNIKMELQRVKVINRQLEKKLESLNRELQKKQKLVEEYEESIAKILKEKNTVEDNFNVYLEVQKNNQKETKLIKEKLSEETTRKAEIEKKLMESEEEREILKKQVEKFGEEKVILERQVEEKKQEFMEQYKNRIAKILKEKKTVEDNFNVYLEVQKNNQKELQLIKKKLSEEATHKSEIQKKLMESEAIRELLKKQVEKFGEEKVFLERQVEEKKQNNRKLQEEFQIEKRQSIVDRLFKRKSNDI